VPSSPPLVATALLAAALFVAGEARAEAPPVRLSWVRGPGAHGCGSPQRIAGQVAARLGRNPFAADAARSVEVYLTRGEGGWRAEIFVQSPEGLLGSRELSSEAADCAPIEAAAVLALALAIDPDAATRPPEVATAAPSPAPVPVPPTTTGGSLGPPATLPAPRERTAEVIVPPPLPVLLAPDEPPPVATFASGAALRAGAGVGLLPGVAPAISLAVEVGVAKAAQITGGALWMPDVRASDARFAFGLTAFALGACVALVGRPRVDLAACGAFWAGALHAVVFDLTPVDPGQHAWAAAEVSPRLRVRIAGPLHAEVGVHLMVPLVRQPFTVTGFAAPVFQQAPVALLPFAGLGAFFP
jgi:hypothetical protein